MPSFSFPGPSDLVSFLIQAYFASAPSWNVDKMPDMTGKVIIVTGGSAGLGKLTVKALLEKNARVYLVARDENKAQAVIDEYTKITGRTAIFLKIDLADLHSIKAAVKEFLSKEKELHVLYNNGGVFMTPMDKLTAQGCDLQFGTNVLGHFYLTKLLLPTLISTVSNSSDKVRVVTITSSAHYLAKYKFNFASLKDGSERRKMNPMAMYSQSKTGNILFASELARRYGDKGIVSTSIDPGNLKETEINRDVHGISLESITLYFLQIHKPELGVLTQLYAGTSPEAKDMNGKYLGPWCRERTPRSEANDSKLAEELWKWMEEQVELVEREESS
ncbi:NAD-P-binding protein [Dendrothele bispora CBS 962.96]|uniref:NAD-P-binding protein n=1 Tax=Dendrothele bispora (strain CBS 962.96) TaxID=1314807 RepID=A0A4S8LBC5_DENBC|nr:NAD-P-binding protein [Dendrothele bispora CBS 962.96]